MTISPSLFGGLSLYLSTPIVSIININEAKLAMQKDPALVKKNALRGIADSVRNGTYVAPQYNTPSTSTYQQQIHHQQQTHSSRFNQYQTSAQASNQISKSYMPQPPVLKQKSYNKLGHESNVLLISVNKKLNDYRAIIDTSNREIYTEDKKRDNDGMSNQYLRTKVPGYDVLEQWFVQRIHHPHPNEAEIAALITSSSLTHQQVLSWLAQRRHKEKQRKTQTRASTLQGGLYSPHVGVGSIHQNFTTPNQDADEIIKPFATSQTIARFGENGTISWEPFKPPLCISASPVPRGPSICSTCLSDEVKISYDKERRSETGDFIWCHDCGRAYHASCLKLLFTKIQISWRCGDCKFCEVCKKFHDEENMLMCENCDNAFHIHCLNPPLQSIPEDNWFCNACLGTTYNPAAKTSLRIKLRKKSIDNREDEGGRKRDRDEDDEEDEGETRKSKRRKVSKKFDEDIFATEEDLESPQIKQIKSQSQNGGVDDYGEDGGLGRIKLSLKRKSKIIQ